MMVPIQHRPDKLYFETLEIEDVIKHRFVLKSHCDELLVSVPTWYETEDCAIHNSVVLFGPELKSGHILVADPEMNVKVSAACELNPELVKG